jgi:hypothetical protein
LAAAWGCTLTKEEEYAYMGEAYTSKRGEELECIQEECTSTREEPGCKLEECAQRKAYTQV